MRRTVLLTWVLLLGCGPDVPLRSIAEWREDLTMSGAGGCDTAIATGLSSQLIEELNCESPGLMVDFSGPNVSLYGGVNPFLAADAARDLTDATNAAHDFITISSAYRTLGEQYLLYNWWKSGGCGIQLAAVPGSSNHQSGRALDVPHYSFWNQYLSGQGWTWFGSSDLVHFDHLASPNIASKSILAFQRLWNRNHGTGQLVEDGAWGPATEGAMAQTPTSGFATHGCPTTGTLSGTVTQQGTSTTLAGVTISAGGHDVTTDAQGTFSLSLPGGTYSVSAAKSGFMTTTISRTVTVGQTTSASLSLTPVSTTGTLKGTVVSEAQAALSGAQVSVSGHALTTDGAGGFSVTLPAGMTSLTVTKSGFLTATTTANVVAGSTTNVTVTLQASSGDEPPVLTLSSPNSGLVSDVANVTLSGTAVDDSGPVQQVTVSVNGGAPTTVPVVNGSFDAPVRLLAGDDQVTLSAADAAGHVTTVSWSGHFRAGFDGSAHRYDDPHATLAGVAIQLVDPSTNLVVGTATSDAQGHFSLEAPRSGTLRVHAELTDYAPRDLLVDVSADTRTTFDLPLIPGGLNPGVRFTSPAPGTFQRGDTVTLTGLVDGLEVTEVRVNDTAAQLSGNAFIVTLPLSEGRTTFTAVASNAQGGTLTGSIDVLRQLSEARGGCDATGSSPLLLLALLGLRAARVRRR